MELTLDVAGLRLQAERMIPVGTVVTVHGTEGKAEGVVTGLFPYGFLCSMHGGRYREFFRYNALRGKEKVKVSVKKKAKHR